jgi:2-polyprenyl-6-hydroxyphenyl methylase/3-demethylubiquinone-9 3-methyltransferase
MKLLTESPDWPESWRLSHHYDRLEIAPRPPRSGYAYAYRVRRERTLDCVQRHLAPGSRILDIAAAQGNFTLALAERGYDVTWNDFRAELEGYVRAKHERGTVRYAPGNALELDFAERFDGVLIGEVIEHVAHPDRFLRSVASFVRPGGWIVLTTPNGGYMRNSLPRFSDCENPEQYEALQFKPNADGHIFLLHDDEIVRLAGAADLDLREIHHFGNLLTNGHMKLGLLLRFTPRPLVDGLERLTTRLPAPLGRKLHAGTVAALRRRGDGARQR